MTQANQSPQILRHNLKDLWRARVSSEIISSRWHVEVESSITGKRCVYSHYPRIIVDALIHRREAANSWVFQPSHHEDFAFKCWLRRWAEIEAFAERLTS